MYSSALLHSKHSLVPTMPHSCLLILSNLLSLSHTYSTHTLSFSCSPSYYFHTKPLILLFNHLLTIIHSFMFSLLQSILTPTFTHTYTLPLTPHPTYLLLFLFPYSLSTSPLTYLSQIINALATVEGMHGSWGRDGSRWWPVVGSGGGLAAGGLLQQENDWVWGRVAQQSEGIFVYHVFCAHRQPQHSVP